MKDLHGVVLGDDLKSVLVDFLNGVSNWDKIAIQREYCEATNHYNDKLFDMDDLDDLLYGKKPTEIIDMVTDDFNTNDNYFYFSFCYNGYACLYSTNDPFENVSAEDIAEHCINEDDDLNNDDIREILDADAVDVE